LLTRKGIIKALKVKTHRTEKMTEDEWVALRGKRQCGEEIKGGVGRFGRHVNNYNLVMC